MSGEDLSTLLHETASLRKRLASKITTGLSSQDVSLATATLQKAEGNEVKRIAAQKRKNELYVEWNTPDEPIHLARLILDEAKQLKIVLELNANTVRFKL
jgi:hypothetical protein